MGKIFAMWKALQNCLENLDSSFPVLRWYIFASCISLKEQCKAKGRTYSTEWWGGLCSIICMVIGRKPWLHVEETTVGCQENNSYSDILFWFYLVLLKNPNRICCPRIYNIAGLRFGNRWNRTPESRLFWTIFSLSSGRGIALKLHLASHIWPRASRDRAINIS